MALVEIEDSVLGDLQKKAADLPTAKAFEAMFDKIGKSEDRHSLLKLIKKHFPETVIPEIDAAKPVYDELEKMRAELIAEKEERAKEKQEREKAEQEASAKRTIAQERKALREAGFDDEGIEKVEEYMRQTGNPDYKSAAAYIKSELKPESPLPSTFAGQRWDWFSPPTNDESHKLLASGPQGAMRYQHNEIAKFLAERRHGRAA